MGFFIPDPRFEMPELFEPNREPVGNVVINWEHPLARGLVGCWLMRENEGAIDLTGNNSALSDTAGVIHGHTRHGFYAKASVSSDRISLGSISQTIKISGNLTEEIYVYVFT